MEKLYVGLDVGSNSVGIACTDENYNLLRARGKDCWAVRLFDEAKTAEKRRAQRTARRRLQRRKYRINQLQALFAPFMEDKQFFLRLNNSQYFADDKAAELGGDANTLFADENFTDKDFHKKYKTIFHLRNALQNEPANDLRLYYLALHHIIKYRGHFLIEGGISDVRDVRKLFDALNDACENTFDEDVPYFNPQSADAVKQTILNGQGGLNKTVKDLAVLFNADKVQTEIIKGFCGAKFSPAKLLGENYKEEKSISFKETTDETFDAMQSTYGDDFTLLCAIRGLYNYFTFEKLFDGHTTVSEAMIAVHEKHASDLKLLKRYVKAYLPQHYNEMFRSVTQGANYVNYVGSNVKNSERKRVKICQYEEFLSFVKKFLNDHNAPHNEDYDTIISEIDAKTFLPKILHSDNGLIPHQFNEAELVKIVQNMVVAFPETAEMAQKIRPLFLFKIPYYVGPLSGSRAWLEKTVGNENTPITPWNFNEVVDFAVSNEKFMRNMTNKCSYLRGEDVLPKCSITYQRFNVLNQLNKLKINETPLPTVELKQKIFTELFLKKAKVSDKMIVDLLVREGLVSAERRSEVKISGKNEELKATMSSYVQLKKILGDFVDEDLEHGGEICENIILWHTLNTDKTVVEQLIQKHYGTNDAVRSHVKQLKGLSFKDFGRLSQKLLTGLRGTDRKTDEMLSIMDLLWETNKNFNEIIFDANYDFGRLIDEENSGESKEVTYADVENMYVSPAVRRGIWQSLQMLDEYVSAFGKVPDKIFVEVTRENKNDKNTPAPRKRQLLEKFEKVEGIDELIAELQRDVYTDARLRQERLYLYFRQLGRCAYTGETIRLDDINNGAMYNVDHIRPYSVFQDDSLDNKVLVLRTKNDEKSDSYPLPEGFSNQQELWRKLRDKELISDKTYGYLTRREPLSATEKQEFVNRQKTVTDQTAKAVIELLKRKYPETQLVYSKASNVNYFKQKFDLHKCRETNDLHHARDAYLNVVVGNVFSTLLASPATWFGDEWRVSHRRLFEHPVENAWTEGSIKTVKGVFNSCTMCVTRYAFTNKGQFYDETVYSGSESITAPRKATGPLANTDRYGGYKSQKTAYFSIVEWQDKKGIVKTIEAVPVLVDYQSKNDPERLIKYFRDEQKLENAKILVQKVKIKQLVRYNGSYVYLAGITDNQVLLHNATELFTNNATDWYVKHLGKLVEMSKRTDFDQNKERYEMVKNRMGEVKLVVDQHHNVKLYEELLEKFENKRLQGISSLVSFGANLKNGKENFGKLQVVDQSKVLLQIFKFFKCDAKTADLTLIGGKGISGKLRINKNITDADVRLIHMSPCGLTIREQKI